MKAMLLAATVLMSVLGSTAHAEMIQVSEDRLGDIKVQVAQIVGANGLMRCSDGNRVSDYTNMTNYISKATVAYVDKDGLAPVVVVAVPKNDLERSTVAISTAADRRTVTEIRFETQDFRKVDVGGVVGEPVVVEQFFTTKTIICK